MCFMDPHKMSLEPLACKKCFMAILTRVKKHEKKISRYGITTTQLKKMSCGKQVEHFRTGNPEIHYSGYPGSEFPKTCGSGYGYGGAGSYGTYGSCATYDHYNANKIDYNEAGCGTPPERPAVSACGNAAPVDPVPAAPCAVQVTENFTGEDGRVPYGCARPGWWGDKACQMPPKHCGGHRCADPEAGCAEPKWWNEEACQDMPHRHCGAARCYEATGKFHAGQAGFETFDGAMDAYPGGCSGSSGCGSLPAYADLTLPGDPGCTTKFESQHNPGCTCTRCMAPYSMPYHVGPGCGEPHCNCPGAECTGSASCPKANTVRSKLAELKGKAAAKWGAGKAMAMQKWDAGTDRVQGLFSGPNAMRNILIAVVAGLLTFRFLRRRR